MSDPWAWRSNMDAPKPSPLASLKPGPEPTGSQRVQDAIYGWLGGRPENRATASALAGLFDVGTLGMATGAYDGAKELGRTGQPGSLAMALMPGAKVAAPAVNAATQAAKKGIRAFHGSPHDFDRFDLSKIGTGEGAQAYGHGLYFAENEGVAKAYRDALADKSKVSFDGAAPSNSAAVALHRNQYDFDKTLADLQSAVQANRGFGDERTVSLLEKDIAEITALRGKQMESPGKMYEVNIKADPEDFLDWDKPLSQQSEKVKAALGNLGIETRNNGEWTVSQGKSGNKWVVKNVWGEPSGTFSTKEAAEAKAMAMTEKHNTGGVQNAYQRLGGETIYTREGFDKGDATRKLREAGIPGIRYLDQGSRGAGEGSRNYVAFDDSLIEILRKYGLLPPAVVGGVAASQSDAQAGQ